MGCFSFGNYGTYQENVTQVFFMVGGPGSGKGTQCDYLVKTFKFKHLSAGDLLRSQRNKGGPQAEKIGQHIKESKLVPSDLTVKVIRKAIAINGVRRYLIDGFPMNKQNWTAFQELMKDEVVVKGLIYLECSDHVMTQRSLHRPKTADRDQDTDESIKIKIETFHQETIPVIDIFKKRENYFHINGDNQPQSVFSELKGKLLKADIEAPQPADVFFVLGGPGSGKGTQCQFMVKQYGFRHLSTGDLLREAVKYGTPKGREIENTMKEGKLVSSELLIELVKEKIERYNFQGRYLLDGFPRGQQNIDVWNKIMTTSATVKGIFYFECEESELVKRLMGRAKTSGRADDNEVTIKKRLKTFHDETEPVIEAYGNSGKLIKINAMQSISKVSKSVQDALAALEIPLKQINKDGAILVPVVGGPGSGKGTQCDKLKEVFGFQHISTGDLLRQQQKNDGLYSDLIDEYIKEGKLVPSDILVQLIHKAIYKLGNSGTILIDGFPRNQQNIDKWNEIEGVEFDFKNMIYFECSQKVMQERIMSRGKTSGRADDNEATIKKRLDVFNKETRPVTKMMDKAGFEIKVNADQGIDEVFVQLKQKLIDFGYKPLQ